MKKPQSREILNPLIEWADVVVENFSPGTLAKLGLDYQALVATQSLARHGVRERLRSEWAAGAGMGSRRDRGCALSGRTYLTGWPDRNPVIPGAVPYGDVIVPYVMAAAVAGALQHRRESGSGAYIDASMYEICVQQTYDAILQAQTPMQPERMGNADREIFQQGVYRVRGDDQLGRDHPPDLPGLAENALSGGASGIRVIRRRETRRLKHLPMISPERCWSIDFNRLASRSGRGAGHRGFDAGRSANCGSR